MQRLPEEIATDPGLGAIPMTWFVRADGQLESILGSATYLLQNYDAFWNTVQKCGHEIGWHPHLYRQSKPEDNPVIIADPLQATDELERLWDKIRGAFHPKSFRNGEGWHTPETYATVEGLGFRCDSTAIPGRKGGADHPMNWEHAPNQPYFPGEDLCTAGSERPMIEIPMNTWLLQAPYDKTARPRYMNPAVHPHIFAKSLTTWQSANHSSRADFYVWVMIFHPDEVLADQGPDALYSRSIEDLCRNLASMTDSLRQLGHEFEWMTVSDASDRWRVHRQHLIA